MHIYFSGIGGTGIGPLALLARQAGYEVSGSDLADSSYVQYLGQKGITGITIGQTYDQIKQAHQNRPIDWFVYSSALPKTDPDHPELRFCRENNIKSSKRDEFLSEILRQKNLKLIAVAGTHGKTTTTAMAIWLFMQLDIPISYSVGAKLSFGDMGHYESGSEYFVYEADEYDRNFLSFSPYLAMITGMDWDHPDIYPTHQAYNAAFNEFLSKSRRRVLWRTDAESLNFQTDINTLILNDDDPGIAQLTLLGAVNRKDAYLVAKSISDLTARPIEDLIAHLNRFPGLSRRFEEVKPGLYTDYAHTPPKIAGALQTAREAAGDHVVVIYEGLHNTRQHFIKDDLLHLFDGVKRLYIVPSFQAREDKSLKLLSPLDLRNLLSHDMQVRTEPAQLDDDLTSKINKHLQDGDLVLALSAGGSGSLDEWLRTTF
jgi:UDP-N-acetylmuramate--alanine ligase